MTTDPDDDPQHSGVPSSRSAAPGRLREVAALFFKLGVIGFGGPAAHIALMRDEVVRRRGWMDDREFLDWVGATNLIPGLERTMTEGARSMRAAGPARTRPHRRTCVESATVSRSSSYRTSSDAMTSTVAAPAHAMPARVSVRGCCREYVR